MPRKSTVRRLPPELREQIGALLEQGRTLSEITAHLNQLGAEVSRSALGRYKQHLDKVGEKLRRSREVAEALIAKLGAAPESKALRLNVELMHGALMDLALKANEDGDEGGRGKDGGGEGITLDPQGAMLLSKALDHLSRASKADAELIGKIKEQARKEAEAKLDKAVSAATGEAKRDTALTPGQVLERVRAIYRGEA